VSDPPLRPQRPARPETREVVELKQLKAAQPDLASAADMQIALLDMQRRMLMRLPLPWISAEDEWLQGQEKAGRALVRFGDIPLEWSDFRLIFRQIADVLLRFEALDADDHQAIVAIAREGNALEPIVEKWYAGTSGAGEERPAGLPASIDHVLVLAMRPFLARCAEVLRQRIPLTIEHRLCPFCGWEPDFAVILPNAERHLICGRCSAQWLFPALTCPYCGNDDRSRITSFATRDGRYRVYGCDVCHRYLKAYDGRQASRPVMVAVDTIATLPLDAAAMQRGYN
jgi:ribosomal protein S27AE